MRLRWAEEWFIENRDAGMERGSWEVWMEKFQGGDRDIDGRDRG